MTPPEKVFLNFTGCRLNEAEIAQMARQFAAQGSQIVSSEAEADLVVINTCAVTNDASRKSRQMILQAGRANPDAHIIATGCYSEFDPAAVSSMPGVTEVISNLQKDDLVETVTGQPVPLYDQEPITRDPLPPGTLGRTRAFIKVQDGCDNRCTFCVTTLVRGDGRSRQLHDIITEVNTLHRAGYKEAVLTGVHLGSYGHDLGRPDGLAELVTALLEQTEMPRIRLSSLEPWDINESFFELWSNPRLCPHIHLPLQSGCDTTLRRMARRTSQESFRRLVDAARSQVPGIAITGDIIIGFPGETDEDFAESLAFVEEMKFARLHVFTYSKRQGTTAARMRGQVPGPIARERYAAMSALSDRSWRAYQEQHLQQTVEVLWESAHGANPDGWQWSGHTGNYLRVFTTSSEPLQNTISWARLSSVTTSGLVAELC